MLHTLAKAPDTMRGVAAVWLGITDAELDILENAGVVGAVSPTQLTRRLMNG